MRAKFWLCVDGVVEKSSHRHTAPFPEALNERVYSDEISRMDLAQAASRGTLGITTDVVALLLSRCPTKMRLTVVAEMLPTTTPQPTQ